MVQYVIMGVIILAVAAVGIWATSDKTTKQ